MEQPEKSSKLFARTILIFLLISLALFLTPAVPGLIVQFLTSLSVDKISVFATIFLGIFIEALPFLLLGTLASGAVEVFVNQDSLNRFIPSNPILGALAGSVMGLFFPVCECGVIPLVRRLFRKGLPLPAGITFLLSGPVLNPVVILSTAAAFGFGKILALRVGLTLIIAVITGWVFSVVKSPWEILKPTTWTPCDIHGCPGENNEHGNDLEHHHIHSSQAMSLSMKIKQVFLLAQGEFFEMGKFLVIGALIASTMQTFIPQDRLTAFAQAPVLSVLSMMILAVILSICSTVDSFIALGFVNTFTFGSIIGFLVFGPMVDIKSALMYWRVFKGRAPFYLILIPFLLSLLGGVVINLLMV
jgi:uncharacterized membrane protein YraQ (UPF0718 family)